MQRRPALPNAESHDFLLQLSMITALLVHPSRLCMQFVILESFGIPRAAVALIIIYGVSVKMENW
jgi:hypothetical protein